MSIIQEALKKVKPFDVARSVKEALTERPPEPPPVQATPRAGYAPESRRAAAHSLKIPIIILAGAGIALVCAGLLYIFHKSSPAVPHRTVKPIEAPVSHQDTMYKTIEQGASETAPPAVSNDSSYQQTSIVRAEPPELVLNGIMYLETGPRAIINNAIVREGDMVNSATVTSINRKSVILKFNNLEITLNLK